jgi:hypothetical protein
MAAWLWDYRSLAGDHLAPVLQLVATAISCVCVALAAVDTIPLGRTTRRVIVLFSVFVAFSSAIGLWRGQAAMAIVSSATPVLLFIGAVLLVYQALATAEEPADVRRVILRLAVLSVVLKPLVYYFVSGAFSISEVRFQIVSGAIVIVMAHCVLAMFTGLRSKDVAIMTLVVVILAISVTRTFLVIGLGMMAIDLLLSWSPSVGSRALRSAVILAAVLGVIAASNEDAWDTISSRWQQRLAGQEELEFDVTSASRIAEVAFQVESITTTSDTALLGNGIAAPTGGVGEYADLFFALFPDEDRFSVGFGHNGPVSILFVAGWLVGGITLLTLAACLVMSALFVRRHIRAAGTNTAAGIGAWSATTLIGVLVGSMSAGIFTHRSESLHFGVALGMLLWAFERMQSRAKT